MKTEEEHAVKSLSLAGNRSHAFGLVPVSSVRFVLIISYPL
jgi:hypothetical protein